MHATRVNEIDLLRFLAALSVVIFHYAFRGFAADGLSPMPYPIATDWAKYGYLGVELFFMISGFVILMTASNGSVRTFVVSRVVRLYPAFWVCCILTYTIVKLTNLPQFPVDFPQLIINLTMMSGFFGVPSIDNAYWSLFVELRFYALIVVILLLGAISRVEILLWLWLAVSIANQFLKSGKIFIIFITDYSSFFIAGALFFLVWSKGLTRSRIIMLMFSLCLGVYQAIISLDVFENHYKTVMSKWVVVSIISIFYGTMLLVSLRRTGYFGRRTWIFAGVVTYPLYLMHQNIGFVIFNICYPHINSHFLIWGSIILMILVAYFIHRTFEVKLGSMMKKKLNSSLDLVFSR